jgi:hypothetical protein
MGLRYGPSLTKGNMIASSAPCNKLYVLLQCTCMFTSEPKSKANNTAGRPAIKIFVAFSQPIHIAVTSSLLIHGSLVSVTKFLRSYV